MFLFRCTHPRHDSFLFLVLAPDYALARVLASKEWNKGDHGPMTVSSRDVVADKILDSSRPAVYMVDDEFFSITHIPTID